MKFGCRRDTSEVRESPEEHYLACKVSPCIVFTCADYVFRLIAKRLAYVLRFVSRLYRSSRNPFEYHSNY